MRLHFCRVEPLKHSIQMFEVYANAQILYKDYDTTQNAALCSKAHARYRPPVSLRAVGPDYKSLLYTFVLISRNTNNAADNELNPTAHSVSWIGINRTIIAARLRHLPLSIV